MTTERPGTYLQENVLTLLCHNDLHGKLISNQITADLFEGDYRTIAERALEFWKTQNEAPKGHTADILGDVLTDPGNRRAPTFRRILISMIELHDSINVKYVMDSVRSFIRTQKIKAVILKSAERINSRQELAITEIEEMWGEVLRTREMDFNPGLRLDASDRVVDYLETHSVEFDTGIPELDSQFIVPARGEVLIILGSANKGKSWMLIHLGKRALQRRKKVVHISLEMSEEDIAARYYQSLFGASKRDNASTVTALEMESYVDREGNDRQRLKGFQEQEIESEFTLNSPAIRDELESHIANLGTKIENLWIKRFPTRSLTMNGLRAYLDQLEIVEGFVADELILDYVGVTKTDPARHRLDLGRNVEEFRAICVERNIAGATAHQVSKAGELSVEVLLNHIAEDWSIVGTCDNILTYSQTRGEKRFGLARLFVAKARTERSGYSVLITQNYQTGQFCLDSVPIRSYNTRVLQEFLKESEDADSGDNEENE